MSTTCCPPPRKDALGPGSESASDEPCCPVVADDRPGYKLWPFVCGWHSTPIGLVPRVTTQWGKAETFGRWQMRWGIGRTRYSIAPGLYAIGVPTTESPVLVTANFKMTFDILRRDLQNHDVWLLVLDTKGVNVWCAAGKGTFGTEEIVHRVEESKLGQVVSHRDLIVPQLGAPGIAAHKVKKACGFNVVYGPVRSQDLPRFLAENCTASPEMRRVTFDLVDRLVLTPVELVNMRKTLFWSALVLFLLGGIGPDIFSFSAAWSRGVAAMGAGLAGVFTGAILVPLLLPWIPGPAFAMKGALAGLVAGLGACLLFSSSLDWLNSIALLIAITAVSSWCAMHFTGSSTFTSPSGVEKEMRQAIPAQAAAVLVSALCWLTGAFQ